jgi:hypothetical protein
MATIVKYKEGIIPIKIKESQNSAIKSPVRFRTRNPVILHFEMVSVLEYVSQAVDLSCNAQIVLFPRYKQDIDL